MFDIRSANGSAPGRNSPSTETAAPIVYIVDDDDDMRASLAWLLASVHIEAVGFSGARVFLEQFDRHRPACLVLDVRMPEMSGFDLQEALRDADVAMPTLFVTGHGDIPMSVRALQNGAIDFVEKPYNSQEMIERVQRALKMAATLQQRSRRQDALRRRYAQLTPREQQVLIGLIDGKASKRIAAEMDISAKTVDVYRANIKTKFGATSLAAVIREVASIIDPLEFDDGARPLALGGRTPRR
ncbi:response regulator [Robbsia sp. KACC 23696]|uniref:response regulator transcription factor n=1 Tax=Robbsia sp. KACC 23696 TaxID=3149231 RepID=UPI00325A90DB